jgi:hypothetical protein
MMRFKTEVRVRAWSAPLVEVLSQAALWSLIARVDVEVNSIDDGAAVHLATSLHGWSLAVDLDTVGDKPAETEQLADYLRRVLHPQYDLVFEGDHVHVEWDAHRAPLRKVVTS